MTTSNDRLKKARIAAGFETAKSAADRFGWKIEAYRHHENGTGGREVPKRPALDYAKKFKVRVDWLLYGQGEMKDAAKQEDIPIYGKAGARERVNLIESDDHEPIDTVTPLRAEDGYHAVIVEGSSMLPAYRDGDVLFFRMAEGIGSAVIGRDCVAITDKQRIYVKRVTRGSAPGTFDLQSYAPGIDPIKDVKLVSAWPVEWIRRK